MRITFPSGALWQHAGFMRLWAAQTVSSFGARITREGLALASVLTIDAKPWQLGILAALSLGPSVVIGFFAGGFVDRSRKRAIMIVCDLLRAAVLMTVPVAAWFHLLTMEQLYVVAALMGGTSVLFNIADHAYLPYLVPRENLMEGNTKLATTESVAEIGGPALAGILVQTLTAPFAIAVNAATYVVSALFLQAIPREEGIEPASKRRPTLIADLRAGFDAMYGNPLLRPLVLMSVLSPVFGGVFSALYVIFAVKTLGLTPATIGLIVGVGGIGSLIGTAIAPWAIRAIGIGKTIALGFLISGLSSILVPLAAGPMWLKIVCLTIPQLIGDSMAVAAIIPSASLRQSIIPRALLGRAAAAISTASGVGSVTGAILGGVAGSLLSPRTALLVAVAGVAATPLLAVFSPLWRLDEIPQLPEEPQATPP